VLQTTELTSVWHRAKRTESACVLWSLFVLFFQVSVAKPEKSRFDPKEVRGTVLKHLLQRENLNNHTYSVSCKSKLHVP